MNHLLKHDPTHPPDRGYLATEQRLPDSAQLDTLSVTETLELINDQDATAARSVRQAIPQIAALVKSVVTGLRSGGRLIYIGAGTSGRLGVLDAAECPPSFHCDPHQITAIIAGGDSALRKSSEGKEDDPEGSWKQLELLNVTQRDVVVGIAAGGTTPYVWGALRFVRTRHATTGLICCVPLEDISKDIADVQVVDHAIELEIGPEVVTGSTRMKAGTATKMVLNMITTTAMVQLGKTWGNLMIDLRATNAKLRDRAARILTGQCNLSRHEALTLLIRADGRVKTALVMAKRGVDVAEAQRLLDDHDMQLRPIIGPPR